MTSETGGDTPTTLEESRSLTELCREPMEAGPFLKLAISITAALADLHRQNITHQHLSPDVIRIHPESGRVTLPLTSQQAAPPFMAPEQTGRLNLPVDHRSDLYSLGIVFYQMLSANLPCVAKDVLEWVHCHIARPPRPLREVAPDVEQPLAEIVVKLLAKNPDERYQSAAGLKWDLDRALAQWEEKGVIAPFPLGEKDMPDRLIIPRKLYGRNRDVLVLKQALDDVVESGRQELLLVAGYSGIGKSRLVSELREPVQRHGGYFICGKFDQYRSDIPFATVTSAFRDLIHQILTESEQRIGMWKRELQAAVGINGQLLIDIIPELEVVIGKQPKAPELRPAEKENRFKLLFRQFIAVFARREHPLVIFLDDLQWTDPGTLKLVGELPKQQMQYLLLVGAYRDNEVTASHPLMMLRAELERSGARIGTLTLGTLSLEALGHLVAETLHSAPQRTAALTSLIHEKTGGNPFFVVHFLTSLFDEELLRFQGAETGWEWDLDRIREKGYTDNIADLMSQKLKKLPPGDLHALQLAACIGNSFELRTLSIISELPEEEAEQALRLAVLQGFLQQTDSGYCFVHDRFQEAAYALVPEQERPALHLRIGRLMLAQLSGTELEEHILEVVNQVNRGIGQVTSTAERERLAQLNLAAGRRAKAATAYDSALHYAAVASALLPEDAWEREYQIALGLELLHAECEYLTGQLESARERLSGLLRRGLDTVDSAAATSLLIDLCTTQDRSDHAVQAGLDYLRRIGVEWPPHPDQAEVNREFDRLWSSLGNRSIEELIDLPVMTAPEWRAVTDVLAGMLAPTLFTDANLYSLVVCRMANLSLEHGNSDGSSLAYVWLGVLVGPRFGDYRAAYRFARLGVDLVEQRGLDRYRARVYLLYYHAATPWNLPLREGPALAERALKAALQLGDLTFSAYSSCNLVSAMLAAGSPLEEVHQEAQRRLDFCRRARFGLIAGILAALIGYVRQLRGLTSDFASFDYEGFDEGAYVRHLEQDPALEIARSWYWIRKLEGAYFAGEFHSARIAAGKIKELLWTMPSHLEVAEYHFFAALTLCALHSGSAEAERSQLREEVRRHLHEFRPWEEHRPDNFADRSALIAAELARLEGRELDAERLYEKALRLAGQHGFTYHIALAFELASAFYRGRGFESFADTYLCYATSMYRRWGAMGKVRGMERQFPLLEERVAAGAIGDVDAITVVKASQAISEEILLSNLLHILMRIVLKNAGARQGVLLLVREEEISVEAQAWVEKEGIEVVLKPPAPMEQILPVSVANLVKRTKEKVIVEDASESTRFASDDYVRNHRPRSILCLPVLRQSELVGLLYLENDLIKGAFTAGRVLILETLAAQAAISLENARLYQAYRSLSEHLEVRVKEAIEELAQKNRVLVLQSRQAIMGEMLGNIAHQWRQPLNTLALLAQELQITYKFNTLTSESLEANVKKTMEIIQNMSRTIDDFRHFFRPDKAKVQFRLLDVLEKVLFLLEGTFQAYNINVETLILGDPELQGYPNEYSQVLLNILNNAKDAFQNRNIEDPQITITVGMEGVRSVVSIADNAGGIPEEMIDKIFDIYFTTKGPEQGTGVGLFMCKSIIEKNMHGSLTVRNTGDGAEFRIEV